MTEETSRVSNCRNNHMNSIWEKLNNLEGRALGEREKISNRRAKRIAERKKKESLPNLFIGKFTHWGKWVTEAMKNMKGPPREIL